MKRCGAKCPECGSLCLKENRHSGSHYHKLTCSLVAESVNVYWDDPKLSAFDKAWTAESDYIHNKSEAFTAGWQARGEAVEEALNILPLTWGLSKSERLGVEAAMDANKSLDAKLEDDNVH